MNKKRHFMMKTALALFMVLCSVWGWGQTITAGASYAQNFDGIGTAANATLPSGWKIDNITGVRTVTKAYSAVTTNQTPNALTYNSAMSASAANGRWNFGGSTANDRAVGGISSGSASQSVNTYLELTNNGATSISDFEISYDAERYRNGTNTAGSSIRFYYSTTGLANSWTEIPAGIASFAGGQANNNGSTTNPMQTISVQDVALNQPLAANGTIYFAWSYSVTTGSTTSNVQALGIDNVLINANSSSTPVITAAASSLTTFTYVEGSGPSAEQSFTVSGSNLTDNITVSAPTGFEVSKTTSTGFADNLSFTQTAGNVATTPVYVRMKENLPPATYSGNIGLNSTGATTVSVGVSGTVTAMPVKPVITAPSSQTATVGVAYSYQIVASENPGAYAIASGTLPSGLNLNLTTGLISGTPTAAGPSSVSVTALNAAGTSDPATIDFTIAKGTQTLSTFVNTTKYASDADFAFPASADNSGLIIEYGSSNSLVATVSGNIIDIVGVGTSTITATQAGDANWNEFNTQIVLTVNEDPVQYNGVGNFAKISSIENLTDGYYVVTNEAAGFLMTNVNSGFFVSEAVTPVSDVISNPSASNVWLITTNGEGRTIYNEVTGKYVGWTTGNTASAEDAPANTNRWKFTYVDEKFTVNNVSTPVRQLSYNSGAPRFAAYGNATQQELQLFKLIQVTSTIWNGAWSNGAPDANSNAIIAEDYNGPAISAATLTIEATKTLTVNTSVTTGDTTNNGNIIVADGANFVQTGTFTAGADSSFKVRKSTKAVKRLAYINWSSPMAGSTQTLKEFSLGKNADGTNQSGTGTVDNRFFTYNNNAFVSTPSSGKFNPAGAGFLIRTPNDFTTTAQVFNGQFEGTTPNSGTISYDHSGIGGDYVMLGNPYPSAISLDDFLTANPGTTETVYIWNSQAEMDANNQYTGTNYNTYAPGTGSVPAGSIDGYIPVGQAFFVERATIPTTTPFVFTDALRQTTADGVFSKAATANKFWLELTSPSGSKPQMLIGFNAAATAGFDAGFDAALIGSNADALYSTVDNRKLVIDAHGSFTSDDSFVLNADVSTAGSYTIGVLKTEGVFANGQQIWLKDLVTGSVTLISEQPYTFTAEAGIVADRFTLQFKPGGALATDGAVKAGITIFSSGSEIHARAAEHISLVEVYEMSGKLIANARTSQKEITMHVPYKGVVLVKVALQNGTVQTKKLMLK